MRCSKCLSLVEQYFDNELGLSRSEQVLEHITGCQACRSHYETIRREQEFYLQFECDVQAGAEFWPGVSARLAKQKRGAASRRRSARFGLFDRLASLRFSPPVTAIIVMLAIGATIGVMKFTASQKRDPVGIDQAEIHATDQAPPSAQDTDKTQARAGEEKTGGIKPQTLIQSDRRVALRKRAIHKSLDGDEARLGEIVREAEQKYLAAINILSRDINRRRSRLSRETVAQLDQTLAAIDRTILDTRKVVRRHPDDAIAVQYMLAAYSKKVDLLKSVASD